MKHTANDHNSDAEIRMRNERYDVLDNPSEEDPASVFRVNRFERTTIPGQILLASYGPDLGAAVGSLGTISTSCSVRSRNEIFRNRWSCGRQC